MKLKISTILLIGRIILHPMLCTILLLYLKEYIDYQLVLIFGIMIVLFNYGKTKNNFVLSFFISIILSYSVFFLSFGIYLGFGYLLKGGDIEKIIDGFILGIPIATLHYLIIVSIIAPLLMFYSYKILFKIKNTKQFIYIKWFSIVVLFLFGLTNIFFENELWQFIMLLALQLILYEKEVNKLLKSILPTTWYKPNKGKKPKL